MQATVRAQVQATSQAFLSRVPTATPAPRLARDTIDSFARGHGAIEAEWEEIHSEIDRWRQSLIACDASVVQDTLRGFAGRFAALPEQARELPRSAAVRDIVDQIIEALEKEATALRLLRDTWPPDVDAAAFEIAADPFESVEVERSVAGSLRRQAEAKLADLTEKASDSGLSQVEIFSQAFDEIDQKWDRFHQDYEEFRQQETASKEGGQEEPAEEKPVSSARVASSQMGQLVVQFSEIVTSVRALPSSELTRPVAEILAVAVEREDLALRTLRDFVKQDEESAQPTPVSGEVSEGGPTPGFLPPLEAPPAEAVPSHFIDFETRLVDSNGLRHLAAQDLADILTASISETSEETQAAAKALAKELRTPGRVLGPIPQGL